MKNNYAATVQGDIIAECVTFAARSYKEAASFCERFAANGEMIEVFNRKSGKMKQFYKGALGVVEA